MKTRKTDDRIDLLYQLGRRIAYLRKERKMSQLDLAIESTLATSYVSELEKGKRNPSIETLSKVAKALQVTLSELLRGVSSID